MAAVCESRIMDTPWTGIIVRLLRMIRSKILYMCYSRVCTFHATVGGEVEELAILALLCRGEEHSSLGKANVL